MPIPAPSQGVGLRYQNVATEATARANVKPGDVVVLARPGDNQELTDIVKIDGPRSLVRQLAVVKEEAVNGQPCRIVVTGDCEALVHFNSVLEIDTPLVATRLGALSPNGEPGQRIVAYTRCRVEPATPTDGSQPRRLIPVFFCGVTGFGPFQ